MCLFTRPTPQNYYILNNQLAKSQFATCFVSAVVYIVEYAFRKLCYNYTTVDAHTPWKQVNCAFA